MYRLNYKYDADFLIFQPPDMQGPAEDGPTSSIKESLPAPASEPMSSEDSEVSKDRHQHEINNPINREIREPVDREPPRKCFCTFITYQ